MTPSSPPFSSSPPPQSHAHPILLVDDSPSNLEVLSNALIRAGYKVAIEVDGESAIAQVRHNPPILILLDIKMPGMDGFEACRQIKAIPNANQIPIIFMTAADDMASKVEAFELGAVDYITKPFQPEEVLARVDTHTELHKLRQNLEARNHQLQAEVAARKLAEQSLSRLNQDLEARVQQRTAELRDSEQRFRQLAENINEVFWMATADQSQLLYVSPAYAKIWGQPVAPLYESSMLWMDSVHPDDREALDTALPKQLQGTYNEEYRIIRPDGTIRWIHDRAVPIRDEDGQVYRLVGIAQDISDRKQHELERDQSAIQIRNTQKFLQTVINHMPVALFVKDGREENFSQHLLWNQTSEDLFGIKATDALYKTAYDLFPLEQAQFFIQKDREAFQRGVPEDIPEEPVDSKKLGRRILHTVKTPIYDEHQNPQYLLCFSEDITERKQAEAEIHVLNAELEQRVAQRTAQLEAVNQELESFSYSVSHDLRAPLRHIHGFINALHKALEKKYSPLDQTVTHYIEVVDESSKKMGNLIDGLLLLSRVGRRQIESQHIDLNTVVKTTVDLVFAAPDCPPQPIDLKIHPLPSIYGDKTLIQQVFKNLVSNAVKFSQHQKPPIIEIGMISNTTFFIKDNGIGFSMDYTDKLFSPFERLHSQREFKGTGIGLSIVQRIIHRHGGTIWAESEPGQGATFFFTFPQTT